MGFFDDIKEKGTQLWKSASATVEKSKGMTVGEIGDAISSTVSEAYETVKKEMSDVSDTIVAGFKDGEAIYVEKRIEVDENGQEYEVTVVRKPVAKAASDENDVQQSQELNPSSEENQIAKSKSEAFDSTAAVDSDKTEKTAENLVGVASSADKVVESVAGQPADTKTPSGGKNESDKKKRLIDRMADKFNAALDNAEQAVEKKRIEIEEKRRAEELARLRTPMQRVKYSVRHFWQTVTNSKRGKLVEDSLFIAKSKVPFSMKKVKRFLQFGVTVGSMLSVKQWFGIATAAGGLLWSNHKRKVLWFGGVASVLAFIYSAFKDD